ncbi:MAG: flagellar protein FlaG [Firmicutes bacterium]|nr:flagellar protein FlaG [Bacillota bacterium]
MRIPREMTMRPEYEQLLTGEVPKLAAKQVDQVEDVNFKGTKENHRLSFKYNKELKQNVAVVIDNKTGEIVKHSPSATQVDHKIRIKRLMGLHVDEKA